MKKTLLILLAIPTLVACVADVVPDRKAPQRETSDPPAATVAPPVDTAQPDFGPALPADQAFGGTDPQAAEGDPQGPYPQPWTPALDTPPDPDTADSQDLHH